MMNHEEYKEAIALDALGALDGEDRGALEGHVAGCAECGRDAASMRDVASMLAYSAEPVAPPEHLRARLLERVREMSGARQGAARQTEVASEVQTLRAGADADAARVLRPSPERFTRGKASPWSRAVAYGAMAASVVLAVVLVLSYRENAALRGELARLGAESNATRDELARQREETARGRDELAREREVAELLAAPEARMMTLAGTKDAPGAHASFAYDRATGRAVLMAAGLPPAPAGKAYQMWFIASGKPPMPGRVFKTDTAGRGRLHDQIPAEGRDAKTFAVTLEPEGGVAAPTGSMYLVNSAS